MIPSMKRRRFLQALAAAPAAPALQAQPAPANAPLPGTDIPALSVAVPEAAADPVPHFFSPQEFAALRKLSDILMPAGNGVPGALDAGAAEFLDFLIGASSGERQQVYREGLKALEAESKKRLGKSFAGIENAETDLLLAPLSESWTYEPPADPLARFLRAAKEDVRTATVNSREWSLAAPSNGRRSRRGLYWLPID